MTSWKTTVSGIAVGFLNLWSAGGLGANWKQFLVSAGMVALGLFAKDSNVTGGTKQQ